MNITKYIQGKYDPFALNSILFDSAGYEEQIPKSFGMNVWDVPFFRIWFIYLRQIGRIIVKTPRKSWLYLFKDYISIFDNKIVFMARSQNNLKAMQKVIDEIKREKDNLEIINLSNYYGYFPMFRMLSISLFFIHSFFKRYHNLSQRDKRIANYYMDYFLLAPAYTWYYRKLFDRCKPESIIFANDHVYDGRTLIYICEDLDMKTIYVQHASVSYAFPELHFTYSFLDGGDALEKYSAQGKKIYGEVVSLGAIRYDNLSSLQSTLLNKRNCNCIGIAINEIDNNEKANELCNYLLKEFPLVKLKIRSHPAMKRTPFVFDNKDRIIYTCATDESIIDYFKSIDFQISGDSGIHLDAIIAGVSTLAYDLTGKGYGDNYGYVKNGLLSLSETEEEIKKVISLYYNNGLNLCPQLDIIRRFDESYGKKYAGKSHKVVSDFILSGYKWDMLKASYGLEKRCSDHFSYWVIPE